MAVIEAEGLAVERGGRTLMQVASIQLSTASPLIVLGPSGSGKTTLLRTMVGLLRPDRGEVRLDGRRLRSLRPRERADWFAWLPQLAAPREPLAVTEYLAGARFRFDEPRARTTMVLREALDHCGIGELADAPIGRVSGGELQRAQLAGLIAQESRYLVLDEPANHLDPALVQWLYGLLAERVNGGQGLVAVSHDIELALALERRLGRPVRILGLKAGAELFQCASDSAELPERLSELYGVPWTAFDRDGRRFLVPADSAT